jgi:hypothetical protein
LAKKAITTIEHPPYLPDLAPADYFFFPRIKRALKGQRFDDIKATQDGVTRRLQGITSKQYQRCFQDLIIVLSVVYSHMEIIWKIYNHFQTLALLFIYFYEF